MGYIAKQPKGSIGTRWDRYKCEARKEHMVPMGYSTNTGKEYGWYQMGQQHENGERVPLQPDEDGIGYRVQVQLARDREDKKVSGGTSLGCTRPGRGTRDT